MKSKEIKINQPLSKNFLLKENIIIKEYSLNNNYFDPSNHSPPNDFIIKLRKRITNYNFSEINGNNPVIA
jgi:hypothetical protein